jgi:hypothetical protein
MLFVLSEYIKGFTTVCVRARARALVCLCVCGKAEQNYIAPELGFFQYGNQISAPTRHGTFLHTLETISF